MNYLQRSWPRRQGGRAILLCCLLTNPLKESLDAAVVLTVPETPIRATELVPPVEFDLDGDSVIDFVIPGSATQNNVVTQGGNRVLAFDEFGSLQAADLSEGSFVGASPETEAIWGAGSIAISACFNAGGIVCFGGFQGGIEYLGLEFDINGNAHYGWIEIESREFFLFTRIHRWAYESEPGVPIRAGLIPERSAALLLLTGLALTARRCRR